MNEKELIEKIKHIEKNVEEERDFLLKIIKKAERSAMINRAIAAILAIILIFIGFAYVSTDASAHELEVSEYCYTNKDIEIYSNRDTMQICAKASNELTLIKTYDDDEWAYVYYNGGQLSGWIHSWDLNSGYGPIKSDVWIKKFTPMGSLYCTGYTPSPSENGGSHLTCTGARLTSVVGTCVAANLRFIPLYTELYIEGVGYRTVMDTGVAGRTLDILVNSNSEAYALTGYKNVYVVN